MRSGALESAHGQLVRITTCPRAPIRPPGIRRLCILDKVRDIVLSAPSVSLHLPRRESETTHHATQTHSRQDEDPAQSIYDMLTNQLDEILQLVTADPGLPRPAPTQSYWQSPPHALSAVRSNSFPLYTDIAIIGSGITGASVSKTLLEHDSAVQVVVLEARTLCSGATGRNGGQLATNACEQYASLKSRYGTGEAGRIVQFTLNTLAQMRELAGKYGEDICDFQQTQKVRVFLDQTLLDEVKNSLSQLEEDHPQFSGIFSIVEKDRLADYGVYQGVGAIIHPAGTIWPYRLITRIFQQLLTNHRQRYSIETNTPVTSISVDEGTTTQSTPHPYRYRLHTTRGILHAKKVIHCTNGYAGHLLPGLRGRVFPVCGSMTVQDLHVPTIPDRDSQQSSGHRYSWAVHYLPHQDPARGTIHDGLYYLAQSARSQLFFFGGDNASWRDSLNADDTKIIPSSLETLHRALRDFLCPGDVDDMETNRDDPSRSKDHRRQQLVAAWTGIMGFSADGVPLVGRLSESVTMRPGADGEWAAVAFNGYGMANCWLAGEALGMMVLGQDVLELLPRAYLVSAERLEKHLSVQRAVEGLECLQVSGSAKGMESKL